LGTGIAITTETAILIKLTGRGAAIPIQSIAIITLFRAFNYTIATDLEGMRIAAWIVTVHDH
jgi:hypothetical protein